MLSSFVVVVDAAAAAVAARAVVAVIVAVVPLSASMPESRVRMVKQGMRQCDGLPNAGK